MKIAVRFYTKTGNTKRLAQAVAEAVGAEADKVGIKTDEREFHCKGEFKGIHKGKPDESDMKAAAEFARKIVE